MLFDCLTIDPHCSDCISYSICTTCDPGYFPYLYSNLSSMCQLCSLAITGCHTCTDSITCVTCITPTYIKDASICQPCNLFQPYCLDCFEVPAVTPKQVNCLACMSYYGLSGANNCVLCSSMIAGCQLCLDSTTCTKCLNGYYIDTGTGVCVVCSVAINNCAICDNSTYCTLCNSDSYLSNNNANCICNSGLYPVAGLCSVPGCSSAIRFTNTVCLACSTINHFRLVGTNCTCMLGYTQTANACIVTCGDGLVLNENCDDGNVISGDGCSSTCQVETNYNCVNGTVTTPSVCVYVGAITVSLTNIVKSSATN